MTVGGVLLAGGAGSRFLSSAAASPSEGTHKLLAEFRGRPLLEWSLSAICTAGFNSVIVVTGAKDLTEPVADIIAELELGDTTVTVGHNPNWAEGQATSIAVGLAWAADQGHDAVVVGLADQPLIPATAWRAVGAATGAIVTATFAGQRRPPVKLAKPIWDQLPTTGDEGARALFRTRPDLISEVPCDGNPADIDTMEDLRQWS